MSFDLVAWKAPAVKDEDEALAILRRFDAAEDPDIFEQSEDLLRFYDDLLARYPALETFDADDERLKRTPWSETPERSDRVIEMSIRWHAPDEALDTIVELARKYDLVLYDPQGPALHSPDIYSGPEDIAGQAWYALRGGGVGLSMVVAGTFIPYRLVSWPLFVVGGFLVVMTVYTLVVLWKPEWRPD